MFGSGLVGGVGVNVGSLVGLVVCAVRIAKGSGDSSEYWWFGKVYERLIHLPLVLRYQFPLLVGSRLRLVGMG